jgi:hypothetical protein
LGGVEEGWPAVPRLALHGRKVSILVRNSAGLFRGSDLQSRLRRNGRHPLRGFAPPVLGAVEEGFEQGEVGLVVLSADEHFCYVPCLGVKLCGARKGFYVLTMSCWGWERVQLVMLCGHASTLWFSAIWASLSIV